MVRQELTAEASLAAIRARIKLGIAMAAIMRIIATTISSSMSENPSPFQRACICLALIAEIPTSAFFALIFPMCLSPSRLHFVFRPHRASCASLTPDGRLATAWCLVSPVSVIAVPFRRNAKPAPELILLKSKPTLPVHLRPTLGKAGEPCSPPRNAKQHTKLPTDRRVCHSSDSGGVLPNYAGHVGKVVIRPCRTGCRGSGRDRISINS